MNSNKLEIEIGDLVEYKTPYEINMRSKNAIGIVVDLEKNFYTRPVQDRVAVDWFNKDWGIVCEPRNCLQKIS